MLHHPYPPQLRRRSMQPITIPDEDLDALRAALPADLDELSNAQLRAATVQWLDETLSHVQEHLVHYLTRQRLNRAAFDDACQQVATEGLRVSEG